MVFTMARLLSEPCDVQYIGVAVLNPSVSN